jgi:hypothetical protein
MTRRLPLGTLLATSLALFATACQPTPVATNTQSNGTVATTSTTHTAATVNPSGVLGDDPSGLLGGRVAPVGAPPGPLAPAIQAAGQQTSQDLATALGTEQEMDVYAMSFDKGNAGLAPVGGNIVAAGGGNIVAAGGGNIVATGGGNYTLLADAPTAPIHLTAGASAPATPAPLPGGLLAHFYPTFGALTTPSTREKVVARQKVQLARLSARAQSMPELGGLRDTIKSNVWIANADGTLSKTIETDINKTIAGATFARHVVIRATVHAGTDLMLHHIAHFELDFKDGSKRITTREVVMLDDGTHHIEFHQDVVGKFGFHHIVDWTKSVDLEGLVSGHGSFTIVNPKGKVTASASIDIDGSADAPHAHSTDANSKLETKVSLAASGQTKATVRDPGGSTGEAKVTVDATPTSSAIEDAVASATPSVSPVLGASPATGASQAATNDAVATAGATTTPTATPTPKAATSTDLTATTAAKP